MPAWQRPGHLIAGYGVTCAPARYQVQAAIAALHGDAASAEETDWPQILAWYHDFVALTDDPCARTPPRCSAARSRLATSSVPPPGCARPTGCAR
jgi:predicted RNA polymerase sigma factor